MLADPISPIGIKVRSKYLVFTLLFASLFWVLQANATPNKCDQRLNLRNKNANTPPEHYLEPHFRPLVQYIGYIGETPYKHLLPGAVIIDIGGGLGVAGLELAQLGYKSIVINAQDFLSYYLSESNFHQFQRSPHRFKDPLISLSKALKVPVEFNFTNPSPESYYKMIRPLKKEIDRLMASGAFVYLPGFAEVELPKLINLKVQVLTDIWAAFSYSDKKKELLELYYQTLDKTGVAYIFVSNTVYESQTITLRNGHRMYLVDWLVLNYPKIFSLQHRGTMESVLVMKKYPELTHLVLPITLNRVNYDGWGPPFVVYLEN